MKLLSIPLCLMRIGRPPHGGRGLKCKDKNILSAMTESPSPRRAWIEMPSAHRGGAVRARRPPHGGRGLKLRRVESDISAAVRRPPHGGRGLKFTNFYCDGCYKSRPPHGGRGLKSSLSILVPVVAVSPSPRRAWIEIDISIIYCNKSFSRPPHGGRGLKSFLLTASPG